MRTKLVTLALAGALAFVASVAPAQACTSGAQHPGAESHKTQDLPTGGYLYGDSDMSTGGYTGVSGSHGYVEAGGNRSDSAPASDGGLYVQGRSNDAPLEGRVFVGPSPSACVNGAGV